MKATVILNETHSLMEEQKQILNKKYGSDWSIKSVPATGWTLEEMGAVVDAIATLNKYREQPEHVIFASPVPAMIKIATEKGIPWSVFHNDHREKKELPNGKIIMTVVKTGWQLV